MICTRQRISQKRRAQKFARLFAVSLFAALLLGGGRGTWAAKPETVVGDVRNTLNELRVFQQNLHRLYGIRTIYISGGSAIAALDAAYLHKPLSFRDLDFIVVVDREVSQEFARQMAQKLTPTHPSRPLVWPMPRTHPDPSHPRRTEYRAGYGFEIKNGEEAVLDVNVMHSLADMQLNGALDIERVKIPLDVEDSLEHLVTEKLAKASYEKAVREKWVLDLDRGYPAWRSGTAHVINWDPIVKNPENWSLRLARAFHKLKAGSIPTELKSRMTQLIQEQKNRDRVQLLRNLQKNLGEEGAAFQLKMIAEMGGLRGLSPALQSFVEMTRAEELARMFEKIPDSQESEFKVLAHARLQALLSGFTPEPELVEAFLNLRGLGSCRGAMARAIFP